MTADKEQIETPTEGEAPQAKTSLRRPRRRGGRGRGRKTTDAEAGANPTAPTEAEPSAPEGAPETEPGAELPKPARTHAASETRSRSGASRQPVRREPQSPARKKTFQATQQQVQEIIATLQRSLEEMEEVQRVLVQVEQERSEDLKDLDSLRRKLDQLQSLRSDSRSRSPRRSS